MAKTYCIFGGSFSPPTLSHLFIAIYLADRFDEVTVVPCYKHVFNKDLIEFKHRWAMCALTFPIGINVSMVEQTLGGLSTTARTVEYYKNFHPVEDLYFAVGRDAYLDFDKWKDKDKLLSMAKPFIVDEMDIFPAIHSTQIRNDIKDGYPEVAQKYLPKKVFEYIIENKLYK